MAKLRNPILSLVYGFAGRLRFPQLFVVVAGLFLVDLFVPDLIPFADEVLLGLATLLLGTWKRRRGARDGAPETTADSMEQETGPVIDVEPER